MIKIMLLLVMFNFNVFMQTNTENSENIKDAPLFSLPDLDNNYIALRDLCGEKLRKPWRNKTKHVIVLSFFATWCKPCIAEIPHLQKLKDRYSEEPVKIFLVNVGEQKDKIQKFISNKNITLPILMDKYKKISEKYGALTLPRLFVIDKNGKIQLEKKGFKNPQKFEADLDKLLSSLLNG